MIIKDQEMSNSEAESSSQPPQAESSDPAPAPPPPGVVESEESLNGDRIIKSGALFLSSRGIGWTSWKKRWFILTETSLLFFRSDPNAVLPKGSEVLNITLGGIDLNSSGSVEVNEERKLITVQFPDSQNGHTVTLKAETLEELVEWKVALVEALANAPASTHSVGQSGTMKNDQSKDKQPAKSTVIGRPVLLALEEIDGAPSFLEKALRFVETQGVKVEGILRQSADVEHVESRIKEYEQGKIEFLEEEDAHVIADCVKYVLRELPSSPVPASCCNALVEALRTNHDKRLSAMRNAIYEAFPEPNRRLLQRILTMMQTIAANKAQNRMSVSAVAACMAPLLLRPLLSGECELQQNSDIEDDSSAQLLQAAAAANNAQAICIFLLEQYDNLFGVRTLTTALYSETEESGSESGELTEDDGSTDGSSYTGTTDGSATEVEDDYDHTSNRTGSEAGKIGEDDTGSGNSQSMANASESGKDSDTIKDQNNDDNMKAPSNDDNDKLLADPPASSITHKAANLVKGIAQSARRPTFWGRSSGRRNLSMESIDAPIEEEADIQKQADIQKLQATKVELQSRIAEEAKGNEQLLARLEKRRNSLHERKLLLQEDVARLQDQLDRERELRIALEAGLQSGGQVPASPLINRKAKEMLEDIAQTEVVVNNLKQKADDLGAQVNLQVDQNSRLREMKVKSKDVDSAATSNANKTKTRRKSKVPGEKSSEDSRVVDLKSSHNPDGESLSSPGRGRNLESKDVDVPAPPNANKKKTRRKSQVLEEKSTEDSKLVDHKSSHNPDGESLSSSDKGRSES